jgi:predicted metal-dependent hydrolase
MSLPLWAPEDEALAFLRDRADWVRDHLDRAPEPRIARIGEAIPVCAVPRPVIVAGPGAPRVSPTAASSCRRAPGPGPR